MSDSAAAMKRPAIGGHARKAPAIFRANAALR